MRSATFSLTAGVVALVGLFSFNSTAADAQNQAEATPNATVEPKSSSSTPVSTSGSKTPSTQYVIVEVAEVRLAPDAGAEVTNRSYKGQAEEVYETKNGWARVSPYYDGEVEGKSGQVARWIASKSLDTKRPADPKGLHISKDPRISLPLAPGDGLNERDVLILHAAARYYLEIGLAKLIEFGDKSVSKAGVYYLNFGEPQNHFFRPSDIPDLEARIQKLQK